MNPVSETLRLHHFLPSSCVNGPGKRAVVWVQGCTLGCPGCFNPLTHTAGGGTEVKIADLCADIARLAPAIEGLTISGGEPLQQPGPVLELCRQTRTATNLSIVVFTGFEWREMERMPWLSDLTQQVDVIITGRFNSMKRLARGLLGSTNKTIHCLTARYQPSDFIEVPIAEVIIGRKGEVTLTGIDPLVG
jgi:anaerobic ribonucleoside-triphosphate reductase activating protein